MSVGLSMSEAGVADAMTAGALLRQARENAGMHIPWEARARAAKGVDVYGMERAV